MRSHFLVLSDMRIDDDHSDDVYYHLYDDGDDELSPQLRQLIFSSFLSLAYLQVYLKFSHKVFQRHSYIVTRTTMT